MSAFPGHDPRSCVWCDTDISAPGMAKPVMYARGGQGPEDNWQCTDDFTCYAQQIRLATEAGAYEPERGRLWAEAVAALAASGKGEK